MFELQFIGASLGKKRGIFGDRQQTQIMIDCCGSLVFAETRLFRSTARTTG